ncbi:MAG: Flp pilus assembly complex ATPase component TadA [Patescibacteria group bacterium]|nr:Flp pilus assembly complex ATPase component TadA [Patescibacteria group bacterium]
MERELDWLKGDMLGEDEMRRGAARSLGVPFVILSREDISPDALTLIPEPLSRAHTIVAYRAEDGTVEVALLDIADLEKIDFLKLKTKPRLTNRESVKLALLQYQKILKEKFAALSQRGVEAADSLLSHALQSNATHVHLEPAAAGMLVRYRIRGALVEAMRLPQEVGEKINAHFKSLAKLFPVSTAFQEGRFKVSPPAQAGHNDEPVSVQVRTVPGVRGEKLHLRLAREKQGQTGYTLESLGLHGGQLERLHEFLDKREGLLLACGPRGSGKTTTLYTLLDLLNSPHLSIATIENSIEFHLPLAAQTRVRPEIGLTIDAGLRALLRTDHDVVMVGDVNSRDTVALMQAAAKRGVFMLGATEDSSLVEGADCVINGRLVKKLCQHCKAAYTLLRDELEMFETGAGPDASVGANFGKVLAALKEEDAVSQEKQWKDLQFYKPAGCEKCDNGYKGYVGLQEVIVAGESGLNVIEEGLFKAAQGLTSVEEAAKVAQE